MTPQQAKFQRRVEEALKARRLTIIIGAGASINAISTSTRGDKNGRARALESMSWYGLLRHGLSYLKEEQIPLINSERTELATLTTAFHSNSPSPTDQEMFRAATLIKDKLTQSRQIDNWFDLEFEAVYDDFINHDKNPILDSIAALYKCGARIVTTNYDDLVDKHIEANPILDDETPALTRFFQKDVTGICHIHGVWWHTKGAIFDDLDYQRVQQDDRIQQCLKTSMTSNEILLFIGTGGGLRDPNFGNLLRWAAKWNDGRAQRHFLLAHHQEQMDSQARDLNIIWYGQSFQDLPVFLEGLARSAPHEGVTSRIISYPRRKVAYFVPRKEQLEKLQNALQTDNAPSAIATDATAVLTGIGGCGKTQLALMFCELAETTLDYHSIIWIDASSQITTEQAFIIVAEQIPGVQSSPTDVDQTLHAVLNYISHSSVRWLLVFDNFDDPTLFSDDGIRSFWPPQRQNCSILITSRHILTSDLTQERAQIDMTRMSEDEALYLLQKAGDNIGETKSAYRQVVQRLGYHALAIDQACFIIQRSGRSAEDFLRLYEKEKRILNQVSDFSVYKRKQSPLDQGAVLNVFTTLMLSWDLIQDDSTSKPDKQHLMVLLAFFNGTRISSSLFEGYNKLNKNWMKSCYRDGEWSMITFEEILQKFCRMSLAQLLKTDDHGIQITVHPLVQDWAKIYLSKKQEYPRFTIQSIQILGHGLQQLETFSLEKRRLMLLHAETISFNRLIYLSNHKFDFLSVLAIEYISKLYYLQSEYNKAKTNASLVLQERERDCGSDFRDTCRILNFLGGIHIRLGEFDAAECRLKQLTEASQQAFGQKHPDTLLSQGNLAMLYQIQGRWKEAEKFEVKVLDTRKRVLGEGHFHTLGSQDNLVSIYAEQRRWKEAEELETRVIEAKKRLLGQEDRYTLFSQGNLAMLYASQGRLKEAEKLEMQVVETRKRVLGQEHPDTLSGQDDLALIYEGQGRWKEAEKVEVQVMETKKRVFGQEHPDTLRSMELLAHTLKVQNHDEEAVSLMGSCVESSAHLLGLTHHHTQSLIDTLTTWNNAAQRAEREKQSADIMPGAWID